MHVLWDRQEALSIREEHFGRAHPHAIAAKQNLAELLRAMGREDRALELQQDIIATIDLRNQAQQQAELSGDGGGSGGGEGGAKHGGGIVRPVDAFFDPNRESDATDTNER